MHTCALNSEKIFVAIDSDSLATNRLPLDARRAAFGKARTCSSVAMVVSPGKVVSSAPCAQPRLTASCSGFAGQQAVEKAGGKAIPAADPVVHIQLAGGGDEGLAIDPGHRAPTVVVGGMDLAQGGGDDLDLWDISPPPGRSSRRRRSDRAWIWRRLRARDAQTQLQVFLVAHQHIHVLDDAADD